MIRTHLNGDVMKEAICLFRERSVCRMKDYFRVI